VGAADVGVLAEGFVMLESHIQAEIRLALGKLSFNRMFRNSKGQGWMGNVVRRSAKEVVLANPRAVPFGVLAPGSSDLLGLTQIVITPEMVGRTVAVFTALEVKRPGVKPEPEQDDFVAFVNGFGGRAAIVRSVDDAVRAVQA
jgi:hypothetical protein